MVFIYILFSFYISYIWFDYFKRIDIFEQVPIKRFLTLFILGAAFTLPIIFNDELGIKMPADVIHLKTGLKSIDLFIHLFLNVGLMEEICKLLPLLIIYLIRPQLLQEPIHWILFTAASALGFAGLENVNYFLQYEGFTITSRGILTPIGHVFDSTIGIYGIIIYLYHPTNRGKMKYLVGYFALAVFMHSLYDWALLYFETTGSVNILGFLFAILIYLYGCSFFIVMVNNALNNTSTFTYHKFTRPDIISKRLQFHFSLLFLLSIILTGFIHGKMAFLRQILSLPFFFIPTLIIVSRRLSRLKFIQGHWFPVRLELPMYNRTTSNGSYWAIRGDQHNESLINTYYERFFYVHPLSKRNTRIERTRMAFITKKIFVENERALYLVQVYSDDQKSSYEPMILEAKKEGAMITKQGYPICALYSYPKIDSLDQMFTSKTKFSFVEWVVLTDFK